jgi:hypothetical protein
VKIARTSSAFLFWLALLPACVGAQTETTTVHIQHVEKLKTTDGQTIFRVAYDYDYPGEDAIYIQGLGIVSSKGSFEYFTPNPFLEFRRSANGPVLNTIPLKESQVSLGDDSPSFSRPSDFPLYLTGNWTRPRVSFQSHVQKIIDRHFVGGKYADQVDKIAWVISSEHSLSTNDDNLFVYIIVAVSSPFDVSQKGFAFHLSYLAHEKRKLGKTTSNVLSAESKKAVESFIQKLQSELEGTDP